MTATATMPRRRSSAFLLSIAIDAAVALNAAAEHNEAPRRGGLRAHGAETAEFDGDDDESDWDIERERRLQRSPIEEYEYERRPFRDALLHQEQLAEEPVDILSENFDASNLIPQIRSDASSFASRAQDVVVSHGDKEIDVEADDDDAVPRDEGSSPEKYIVGGSAATVSSYPFFAMMRGCDVGDNSCLIGGGQFDWGGCGGTLISDRHVLTAGHCVDPIHVQSSFELKGFRVGGSEWAPADWNGAIMHPRYDENNWDMPEFDAAVVELISPVTQMSPAYVDTGSVADQMLNGNGGYPTYVALGHGKTEYGRPSSTLLEADMFGLEDSDCTSEYGGSYHTSDDSMLCAGQYNYDQDRTSTCNGDSGGPLLSMNSQANEQIAGVAGPILMGVTSWGPSSCRGGIEEPSVFAKVGTMIDWFGPLVCNSDAYAYREDRPDWCRFCDGSNSGWCQNVLNKPSKTTSTTTTTTTAAPAATQAQSSAAPQTSSTTTSTATTTTTTTAAPATPSTIRSDLTPYEKRCREERSKQHCSMGNSNMNFCSCGWLQDMTGEDGAAYRRQQCWSPGVKRTCPNTCQSRCNYR